MNTFIKNKPSGNLAFVNLKTFISEHFNDTPYRIVVENDNYLQSIYRITLPTGVYAQDRVIDCNLRVIETYMPEYLLFIMQHCDNNVSIRTAIQQSCETCLPNIPNDLMPTFLEYKMFHFLEAIICSNFSREVWRGVWQRDRCYVVKNNGELEYYTVYDYRKLVVNLLDWLLISKTTKKNVWSFTLFLKAPYIK